MTSKKNQNAGIRMINEEKLGKGEESVCCIYVFLKVYDRIDWEVMSDVLKV